MLLTKKVACPSCDVKLKVADTLPAGKVITCPKCGTKFPVPEDSGDMPMAASGNVEARKAGPAEEGRKERTVPASAKKKTAFRREEEEEEARPKPRKRRKKPQPATSNTPLILGLVIGGAVAVPRVRRHRAKLSPRLNQDWGRVVRAC
jgi:hypothetical protein